MSHFLFFVSRNTQLNKAAIGCPFFILNTTYNQHNGRPFGDFVVLLLSTYRRLASLNDVFLAPLNGVHLNVACALDLGVVYYTSAFFTALVLFDTGCRLVATRRSTLHF
jgi:hypothetical protein